MAAPAFERPSLHRQYNPYMQNRHVMVLGSTGLVGGHLVDLLLDDSSIAKVTTIVRRPSGRVSSRIDEQILELDAMSRHPDLFAVDQIFCALGTTIRKAGSQERFRAVDLEYPVAAAKLGLERGASHYLLVSSLGADANSRFFYNRVKGELEDRLAALGFRSVTIARPSLLLGERAELRRGERIGAKLGWLMPPAYKPIEARTVARALVDAAREDAPGMRIMESREMRAAGDDR